MEKNNHRGPQNYSPFLPAFGMAGGTESACLAGKHWEPLFSTVGTPDLDESNDVYSYFKASAGFAQAAFMAW